jgi:hypothetical protein
MIFGGISIIVFIASVSAQSRDNYNTSKANKGWVLACSIISMIVGLFLFSCHYHGLGSVILGSFYEGVAIIVILIFEIVLVALATGPRKGVAVDEFGAVSNGNLYYFSWAGFFAVTLLLSSYTQQLLGLSLRDAVNTQSSSFKFWMILLATSLVVMGCSADIYNETCDFADKNKTFCSRTIFAVVCGCLSTVFALVIVVMKILAGMVPFLLETGVAVTLFILYCFEVAYITSPKGPGSPLGNLYYFSWLCFVLSFMVCKSCYEDYTSAGSSNQGDAAQPHSSTIPEINDSDESPVVHELEDDEI